MTRCQKLRQITINSSLKERPNTCFARERTCIAIVWVRFSISLPKKKNQFIGSFSLVPQCTCVRTLHLLDRPVSEGLRVAAVRAEWKVGSTFKKSRPSKGRPGHNGSWIYDTLLLAGRPRFLGLEDCRPTWTGAGMCSSQYSRQAASKRS